MNHHTTSSTLPVTIGIDLGTRRSYQHTLDSQGWCSSHGSLPTTRAALARVLPSEPARVVIEASGCCRWVASFCEKLGHEVVIANPRKLHLITKSEKKTDRRDARILAEIGQFRPALLNPIQLRGEDCQRVRVLLAARRQLIGQRTELVNFTRGQMRTLGEPLPSCSTKAFPDRVQDRIPAEYRDALEPILEKIRDLNKAIDGFDRRMREIAKEQFPETELLRQVSGVGPVLALSYVATCESPERFESSRSVGPYVGLVPKKRDSAGRNPQLSITKCGDRELRSLLVSAATWILGPFGPDCDLRRYGERIRARGDQRSRAKARVAVARKLAVLLHRLWKSGEVYVALLESKPAA